MRIKISVFSAIIFTLLAFSQASSALTMSEFSRICGSNQKCSANPILQAYVGGALDLLAMLDEETKYLQKFYCKKPKELFDVPQIIQYMELHQKEYTNKNAMLLVIRYLEEKGGC